jgi:hypothetical protein
MADRGLDLQYLGSQLPLLIFDMGLFGGRYGLATLLRPDVFSGPLSFQFPEFLSGSILFVSQSGQTFAGRSASKGGASSVAVLVGSALSALSCLGMVFFSWFSAVWRAPGSLPEC